MHIQIRERLHLRGEVEKVKKIMLVTHGKKEGLTKTKERRKKLKEVTEGEKGKRNS